MWVRYDDPDRVDRAARRRMPSTGPRLSKNGRARPGPGRRARLDAMTESSQRPRPAPRAARRGARRGAPQTLDDMAGGAFSSPYHFSRQLSRSAGEPPVAMRRRVMLERAAWQIRQRHVGDRRGVRGRLRVGRGLQPGLRPRLRPPAEPAADDGEPLAARAQRHPLPPAHVAVGPHHGATDEPARPNSWSTTTSTTPATCSTSPSSCPTRSTAATRLPGSTVLGFDGPEESRRRGADPPRVHQGGLARRHRGRGLPARARRRPGDADRAARGGRATLAAHGRATSSGAARGTTG